MSKPKRPKVSSTTVRAGESDRRVPKLSRLGVLGDDKPFWRFALVDVDGPWGWGSITPDDLRTVLAFMREMERTTWREIRNHQTGGNRRRGAKHKFIPQEHCITDATKRLTDVLELDEFNDSWFRFRVSGERRLWGVVQGTTFYPVWWDPRHEVCPGKDR